MTRKARSHDVLGKLSAFSMAVILLLSIFVPMFASTVTAGAASNSYTGTIYLDLSKNSAMEKQAQSGKLTINNNQVSVTQNESGFYTATGTFSDGASGLEIKYENVTSQKADLEGYKRLFYIGNFKHAYFWNGDTTYSGVFPGEEMKKFAEGKYYIDYDLNATMVIFNNGTSGTGNQTDDLAISSDKNVYNDSGAYGTYNAADWTYTEKKYIKLGDRQNDYSNAIYVDAQGNLRWSRYDHSKGNPYQDTESEPLVEVKLYAPSWDIASVLYDLDDPRADEGTPHTSTGEVTIDGTAYSYFVLEVPKNSAFKFYRSNQSSGTSTLYVQEDNVNLYYSIEKDAWVTAANLAAQEKSDIQVTQDNFANPTGGISGSGTSVIGVDAMYFDYLSDKERAAGSGWRRNLQEDNFDASYRNQFSEFNNFIASVAQGDSTWKYPLFFGDDYNGTWYLNNTNSDTNKTGLWDKINSRYNWNNDETVRFNTQQTLYAVNNSGGMSGDTEESGKYKYNVDKNRDYSIQGLVNSTLNSSGKLTVGSNGNEIPYFNYDLLHNNAGGTGGTGGTGGGETQLQIKTESLGTHSDHDYYKITLPRKYTRIIINNKNNGSKTKDLSISTDISGKTVYAKSEQDNFYVGRSGCPSSSYDDNYWYIVVENEAKWTDVYAHYWKSDSDSTGTSFPGVDIKGNYTYSDPDSGSSGSSSGTEAYATVVSAKFPFVATKDATTGVTTYSFDSTNATDNVYFTWDGDTPTQVNYGAGSENYGIHNRFNSSGGSWGIFPFNNGSSSNHCLSSDNGDNNGGTDANGKRRDYGFGIKMSMKFTLPKNGIYGSESSTSTTRSGPTNDEIWIESSVCRIHRWYDGQPGENISDFSVLTQVENNGTTYYVVPVSDLRDSFGFAYPNDTDWKGDHKTSECRGKAYKADGTETTITGTSTIVGAGSSTEQHATFNYSGDDDLWVFIDGQLVLDLGGAHTPTTGSIDFGAAPGKIAATADKVYLQVKPGDNYTTDVRPSDSKVVTEFNFDNTDSSKVHEMVVYYMERGTNDSNLKVSYSIQPVTNDLNIDKTVNVDNVNEGLKTAAKAADSFDFTTTQNTTTLSKDLKDGESVHYSASDEGLVVSEDIKVEETYDGSLKYTTDSFVEDIISKQTITTTGTASSPQFSFYNSQQISSINTSLFAHFTNTMLTNDLLIGKKVVNTETPAEDISDTIGVNFTFNVAISLDNGASYASYPLEYEVYDKNGTPVPNPATGINSYVATNGDFKLKPGQNAKFTGIPQGAKYKITEKNLLGGFSLIGCETTVAGSAEYSSADNAVIGTIPTTDNTTVTTTVVNKFEPVVTNLTAKKYVDNILYKGDEFTFTQTLLYHKAPGGVTQVDPTTDDSKEKYNRIKTDILDGDVIFMGVEYTAEGQYFYSVSEALTNPADSGKYIMNPAEGSTTDGQTTYYAVVTVTSSDGKLVYETKYYSSYNETTHQASDELVNGVVFNNRTATKYIDVSFKKQDENGNPLSGAKFTLYTDAACTTEGTIATVSKADSGFTNPATSAENTGLVTFSQLKYEPSAAGDVKATYYFKETKAPNGYQLLTGTFKIEIAADGNYKISYDNSELSKNADNTIYVVTNIKQPELPIAGGVGVTMFYVLGALAVVIAGTAFVLYKKRINVIALAAHLIHRK